MAIQSSLSPVRMLVLTRTEIANSQRPVPLVPADGQLPLQLTLCLVLTQSSFSPAGSA